MAKRIEDGDTDITAEAGSMAAVAPTEPVQEAPADSKVVAYQGRATMRRITSQQWAAAGISDHAETVWDSANNYEVSTEDLTPEALEVLRRDGSFSVPAREASE